MIALLSGLAGFVSSLIPEVMKMIGDSQAHKRQLQTMEKQAELGLKQAMAEQVKAEVEADMSVQDSYRAELIAAKDSWIAAYSATVRPTITYGFFLLFCWVEVTLLLAAVRSMPETPLPWQVKDAMSLVWGDEQAGIFAFIIGFWYGGRGFRRKGQA